MRIYTKTAYYDGIIIDTPSGYLVVRADYKHQSDQDVYEVKDTVIPHRLVIKKEK